MQLLLTSAVNMQGFAAEIYDCPLAPGTRLHRSVSTVQNKCHLCDFVFQVLPVFSVQQLLVNGLETRLNVSTGVHMLTYERTCIVNCNLTQVYISSGFSFLVT